MLTLKFSDTKKTKIEYLSAVETEEYFNGASRRTLTFEIARDKANLETLDALCSKETNVETLELSNSENGITNIYSGYVLKLKIGVESKLVDSEMQTYEDRIVLKLGKRTYIEEQLHKLGL